MYKLSKKSTEKLNTCHEDLQLIIKEAISVSDIDFGISEGYRDIQTQYKYFKEGKSQIDGFKKKGKHNYFPSLAVDIYLWINGKAEWDEETLSYVSGLIHGVSEMLLKNGKISHRVRWGGNWDMDGEILTDQSFDDRPHFELIKIK